MPLHGKIVVLKRSGGDGTEFPLTASCMFGRKPDCDIRIQIPQVSKEHCRIDLNENKEVILTNLSSANPTCVNGQALQQSERLKHGDVITIIDRSFRFEYPPAPTPKKRYSVGGKAEAVVTDPHLKDGTNIGNIQRSLEKTQEAESKEDVSLSENKTASPFNDLYQMIKKSLDVKTPRKSSISVLQTPSSKFTTPKPESARKNYAKPAVGGKSTPKKEQTPIPPFAAEIVRGEEGSLSATPKSAKKRRSLQLPAEQTASNAESTSARRNATPQKFTVGEAIEQISTPTPKSPSRRRSKETTSPVSAQKKVPSPAKTDNTRKITLKSAEKVKAKPKKRKSEELAADLPTQQMKKKRVSFGGQLSPELFDKRLPPDSPLRKGATPRRSLCLYKPKQSLLRRASVIGLLKEGEQEKHVKKLVKSPKAKSPGKMRTPSPKKSPGAKSASPKTPTPAKKSQSPKKGQSPKSKTPSPKTPSPGKKAATPKKASPKIHSPKSVKTTPAKSPAQSKPVTPKQCKSTWSTEGTPKGKSPASIVPVKPPLLSRDQTPTVQGRFSVSRISTPSPVAVDAVTDLVPSAMVTPKIPLRRKSMKSSAKKTPALKSATKVMCRKSGMMRASMKVMTSWADIVRFGKAKVQVPVPTKQAPKKTTKKKAVPKPQTPKQRLLDHVTTGHAASPATIVVGRAHRLRVTHATGAPPKIVINTSVLQKNMKVDDDLTGISEMFKTPTNKKRQSSKLESSATKTPLADVGKSMLEPSVLKTPEETGEMVVSPISVASTIKGRRYNSEAVQRLLCEEETSHHGSNISLDIQSESTEQQSTEIDATSPKTPQQRIPMSEGLTGVKRMMKTPKQKAEPVEDLRGNLLKTPKQKLEQLECLSAVKRIMKTPKVKASPVEDLRGKLLKTPKQKIQQQEVCLTGVKRIMKTPKEKAVPVEDLRGKLLKTPKQKTKQQEECLSGIKRIMKTPDQKIEQPECITAVKRIVTTPKQTNEPVEDLRGKPLMIEQQECLTGAKTIMRTPKEKSEPLEDIRGKLLQTPKQKNEQLECLTGVKRIMMTPEQKSEEVDTKGFLLDVKRIQRTPKEKNTLVEDMVGVKRLMKTPKERAQPVEKNFGIKRLMRSPRLRGNAPVEDFEGLEELMKEPGEDEMHANTKETTVVDDQLESMGTVSEPAADDQLKAENKQEGEHSEEAIEAPVRGRRGRKLETSVTLPNRKTTRSKNTKTTEDKEPEESAQEKSATEPKPRRGRLVKKAFQTQTEELQMVSNEPTAEPEAATVQSLPVADNEEKQVVKPRRGRIAKAAEPSDVSPTSDATQAAEATESKQTMASVNQEDGLNALETIAPVVAEGVPQVETAENSNPEGEKKPARGRKAKVVATKEAHEKKEVLAAAEDKKDKEVSEEVVAPVRGRNRKRTAAPAAPAIRQRRGRAGKAQNASEEVTKTAPEETTPEHADDQTSTENENSVSEPTEEAVQEKPRRGRKTQSPIESPQPEPESTAEKNKQSVVDDTQSEQPVPAEKPKRGRRVKTQVEPQPEPESKQLIEVEAQPVVEDNQLEHTVSNEKPKRGRKAKSSVEPQSEPESTAVEKGLPVEETCAELPTAAEKPKRGRRTRAAEGTHAPEVSQASVRGKRGCTAKLEEGEKPGPEQLELKRMRRTKKAEQQQEGQSEEIQMTDAAEETPVIEQACPAPKSRRDVQKSKEADNVISEKTTDVPVSSSTDEPLRGRRRKQASEEKTAAEVTKQAPKDDSSKAKPTRGRGKTTVKPEVSDAAPAKRARRGTAISTEESAAEATEEVPAPVEPVKKGRRATAKTCVEEIVSKDQDISTEKLSNAVEDTKTSKRSVKWKAHLEVFEISKVTPVKAVQGRKAKSANHSEAESNSEPKNATNPEEKDLSEKVQPAKRARRGAKAADVAESTKTNVDNTEAETQPKTRRSRLAKK